jgi:hypothetical protein
VVDIDFSGPTDVRISLDALPAGIQYDCTAHRMVGIADASGQVTFRIVGAANGSGPRSTMACALRTIAAISPGPRAVIRTPRRT